MSFHDHLNSGPYELLSSTRFDRLLSKFRWNDDENEPCLFLLLRYHFDRLVDAADQHGWDQAKASMTYDNFKSHCYNAVPNYDSDTSEQQAFKIRLTLSQAGQLAASVTPTIPLLADPTSASFFNPVTDSTSLFGSVYSIHLDSAPTPTSIFTSTKTTRRTMYDDARSRVSLPLMPDSTALADVLMYNHENLIIECSIFNVAFFRSSCWITPSTSTGCLPGTFRRWLLEQGRIREDVDHQLTPSSIKRGDWVLLFNCVQGCRLGRIV